MTVKLVPFGRYRGQPLDRMLDDKGYCEWLMKQDWFVQRFPDIHVVAMNWGNPDLAQTPEHNAMQARFLDVDYAAAVAEALRRRLEGPGGIEHQAATWLAAQIGSKEAVH